RINSFRADSGQSRYARARWLAPTCSYGTNVKARRSLAPRGVLDGDAYAALRKQAARMRSRGLLQLPSAGDNSGGDGAYFTITNNPRWLSVSLFWPEPSCLERRGSPASRRSTGTRLRAMRAKPRTRSSCATAAAPASVASSSRNAGRYSIVWPSVSTIGWRRRARMRATESLRVIRAGVPPRARVALEPEAVAADDVDDPRTHPALDVDALSLAVVPGEDGIDELRGPVHRGAGAVIVGDLQVRAEEG